MPSYGRTSASDIQGGMEGNFNPYTGRLNTGNMVLEFLARVAGQKEKAKQDEWAVEDRDLNKRVKEAQIRNYDEVAPVKAATPTSKVSPVMVKSLMKRLSYPDEAVLEVDTMNDPALKDTWAKLQQDFATRMNTGLRVPNTAATPKGKQQVLTLKAAAETVKGRKARYSGALTQLYANPDKGMLVTDKIKEYESALEKIEEQEGEIVSMMNNIDESGELTEEQFKRLNTILKFRASYQPMPKFKNDATNKLPAGYTIIK
jgi:hypothetical protein